MNINSRFSRLPAYLLALFLSVSTVLTGCGAVSYSSVQTASPSAADTSGGELRYGDLVIPAYSGEPYTVLADNVPTFTPSEETTTAFEAYHALDRLGRCGTAFACLGKELMPTEKRHLAGTASVTILWTAVLYITAAISSASSFPVKMPIKKIWLQGLAIST